MNITGAEGDILAQAAAALALERAGKPGSYRSYLERELTDVLLDAVDLANEPLTETEHAAQPDPRVEIVKAGGRAAHMARQHLKQDESLPTRMCPATHLQCRCPDEIECPPMTGAQRARCRCRNCQTNAADRAAKEAA